MSVTKSQLAKAKRLRNFRVTQTNKQIKIVSKVFLDFANEISKLNGIKFSNENNNIKIIYKKFRRNMKKALKQIFNTNVNVTPKFVKNLFGWDLSPASIKTIQNTVLKQYNEKNAASMVTKITNSTKKQINKIITNMTKEGKNKNEIIKEIYKKVNDMSKGRARAIVRTETNKAISITEGETAKYAGMKKKKWIYTHISKVPRENHVSLNGVIKKFNEKFDLGGGIMAKYPHDPDIPLSEKINCECIVLYL